MNSFRLIFISRFLTGVRIKRAPSGVNALEGIIQGFAKSLRPALIN
jgi:hypothetical protein